LPEGVCREGFATPPAGKVPLAGPGAPMGMEFGLRLGLIAFAAVGIQNTLLATPFETAVPTAVGASVAFFAVGLACGEIARRIVEESVQLELKRAAEQQTNMDGTKPTDAVAAR
jgi:hypothetical protein